MPRAANSATSARSVMSRFSATRARSHEATSPINRLLRWPPGNGRSPTPERTRCDQRTAVATETPKRDAASRTVAPRITAAATRSRRSIE